MNTSIKNNFSIQYVFADVQILCASYLIHKHLEHLFGRVCCVFWPANGCSACRSLLKIICFCIKTIFLYFSLNNLKKKEKRKESTKIKESSWQNIDMVFVVFNKLCLYMSPDSHMKIEHLHIPPTQNQHPPKILFTNKCTISEAS